MSHFISVYVTITLAILEPIATNVGPTYEELYRAGIDAYLNNNWENCVEYFEHFLLEYSSYRKELVKCRSACESVAESPGANDGDASLTGLFAAVVGIALCNIKCEKDLDLVPPSQTTENAKKDFEGKIPYDYLQLCYYMFGDSQKAASSAYTFLAHHPEHEVMQNNLKFYISLPSVQVSLVHYLEGGEFQKEYQKAILMYTDEVYQDVIEAMEKAITLYQAAEDECRHLCEDPWVPALATSFYVTIANHYAHILRCRLNCPNQIYVPNIEPNQSILASHYNYLQYSYYKVGDIRSTCKAVASFLLLQPNDTVMAENQKFYLSLDDVHDDWFQPRQETISYHERQIKEKEIFKFIESFFGKTEDTTTANKTQNTVSDLIEEAVSQEETTKYENVPLEKDANIINVQLEEELNGTARFMADGFASNSECQRLVHLASDGATNGDGYNGRLSPHTHFESFEGLTVKRALTLTQRGLLDPLEVQLLLNVSEKARHYVQSYFKLKSQLYFAYTHLVCRTALNEFPSQRTDLSHPIHADNCVLTKNGDCLKQRPAYTWRDYSAILYLNDDFQGGEFIFAKTKDNIEATVHPKCGRVVGFSAGKENLHGVQAVLKGRRCAVAMWYTLDSKHQEKERISSENIVADLVRNKLLMEEEVPQLKPDSREKTLKIVQQETIQSPVGTELSEENLHLNRHDDL